MLEIKNLSKHYNQQVVLSDINISIKKGEIVSILGPSGSGKTTLLNILLGITQPNTGEIMFDDQNVIHIPMGKRGFGIVFQDYSLFPNLNALDNIRYGLRNDPVSTDMEVLELITLLGLENHQNKTIEQLSGGQKQRVALARTLVMKPRLLLLDEPLSALDGVIKESIKARIKKVVKELQLTTCIVTHDPEEALSLSDKILILNEGKIEQYGTPSQILHQPSSRFVEDFILKQLVMKRDSIYAMFNEGV